MGAACACTRFGDAFCKATLKLLVELSKELECGLDLKQQCQVCLVLLTEISVFRDQILMLPDEGGLPVLGTHFFLLLTIQRGLIDQVMPLVDP